MDRRYQIIWREDFGPFCALAVSLVACGAGLRAAIYDASDLDPRFLLPLGAVLLAASFWRWAGVARLRDCPKCRTKMERLPLKEGVGECQQRCPACRLVLGIRVFRGRGRSSDELMDLDRDRAADQDRGDGSRPAE